MNILTWNIEGLQKYYNDVDLKNYLHTFDIISFFETWGNFVGEFSNFLPSFTAYESVRKKKPGSGRNSGGVCVFVKDWLMKANLVQRIFPEFNDCIVLHFKSSRFLNMQNTIMYFAYVSPQGSTIYKTLNENNGIVLLESNISDLKFDYPDSYFFLAGDLNARTKDFIDYIPKDDVQYIFGETNYESDDFDMQRKNKDDRFNLFGTTLAELCCTFDMHIINGRRFDDSEGNFTCIANDGASVVDYNIASSKLFSKISYFTIEDRDESVHFPIYCQFTFPRQNRLMHTREKPDKFSTQSNLNLLRWNEELKGSFLTLFREKLAISKNDISRQINENIDTAIESITNIYIYISAAKCMFKPSKVRKLSAQPPWWDITCIDLKQQNYSALRRFRKSNNTFDLIKYKDARNLFKHTCRLKKQQYQKGCRQTLMEASKDPKKFWNTVKVSQTPLNTNISDSKWHDHFKSLLFSENQNLGPENADDIIVDDTADILNEEITLDEIISSIKTLKNGKSAGPDSLSAEFYKSTCSEIAPILKDLFNSILDTGVSPKSFGETVLRPIHKSGPTSDPNNFRGIASVNSMHKTFSSILNKRPYSWVEDNKKLDESQAGFRAGYSATDNIFSLSSVVQKYLSRRGGRFYCLYVDFLKNDRS